MRLPSNGRPGKVPTYQVAALVVFAACGAETAAVSAFSAQEASQNLRQDREPRSAARPVDRRHKESATFALRGFLQGDGSCRGRENPPEKARRGRLRRHLRSSACHRQIDGPLGEKALAEAAEGGGHLSHPSAGDRGKEPGISTQGEYDIAPLIARKRATHRFLELGRSCVLKPYRNRRSVELLWQGLWTYIREHGANVMIGCASFPVPIPRLTRWRSASCITTRSRLRNGGRRLTLSKGLI